MALSSFLLRSAFAQHCPSDIRTDYPTIPEALFQRRGASDLKNWGGRVHGRRFPAPGFDTAPDLDSLSLPGAIEMLISEERRATALGVWLCSGYPRFLIRDRLPFGTASEDRDGLCIRLGEKRREVMAGRIAGGVRLD